MDLGPAEEMATVLVWGERELTTSRFPGSATRPPPPLLPPPPKTDSQTFPEIYIITLRPLVAQTSEKNLHILMFCLTLFFQHITFPVIDWKCYTAGRICHLTLTAFVIVLLPLSDATFLPPRPLRCPSHKIVNKFFFANPFFFCISAPPNHYKQLQFSVFQL